MIRRFFNRINSLLLIGIFSLVAQQVKGQTLSGTKTVCSSGCDYPTISSAVNALNSNGVGAGGVTINVAAGHTETLLSGMVLSASGTLGSPIVFQKSGVGNNPIITAFSGNKLASSTDSIDVMWSFEGSDYVTINGIDFQENVLNTTPTLMMEAAIGFYKKSETDGASNNEIKNCVITLNRNNITTSTGVRSNASGSVGIEFVNAKRTNLGTSITVFSASGTNSFNKINGNTIQNCNFGISLIGYAAPSPYTFADVNNEIGGETTTVGNTIINFGGGVGATNPCGAIFVHNQWDFAISNNIVNNNTGIGLNHTNSNRGIWIFASSVGSSCNIKKNIITISGGMGPVSIKNWCLDFEGAASGANSNTINIDSNQFINCNVTSASVAFFSAIWLSTTATNVNVTNNYIYGFRYSGTGTSRVIFSELACGNLNISNNQIDSVILDGTTANGVHSNINVTVAPNFTLKISENNIRRTMLNTLGAGRKSIAGIAFLAALETYCARNIVDSIVRNGTSGGSTIGISLGGTNGTSNMIIRKNVVSNLLITGTGVYSAISGIQTGSGIVVIDSNNIFNLFCQKSSGSDALVGINKNVASTNVTYRNNNIYNLTNAGTGITYGIYLGGSSSIVTEISNNQIHALNTEGLTIAGIAMDGGNTSVFNNKVYDISSSSTGNAKVSGILVLSLSGTTLNTVYNNLVGDLRATSAITTSPSTSPTIVGINVLSSSSSGYIDVSHNTVVINATSTGTVFGTAALFHSDRFSYTTYKLKLRNNILVNKSTAAGAGKTVAYHRSSNLMLNFDSASNRNLYYSGLPSATNLIFYDGTNADQTLGAYQARAIPRDSVSFTENVSFLDTLGASSTFLKINPTIPTFVEATSTLDANVGVDFNNSSRAGFPGYSGTSGTPDLGAWEDNLTPLPINNMYLDSLNAEQTAILAPRGTTNNIVIRIPVYSRKGANALVATSFKLNTIGTTNTADISDARVFYTGANPLFNDSNLFGSVNAPSGIFNVSGSQTLTTGVNYFWLTYTISATATLNNFLDARLDSITLSGIQYAPINSSPNGVLTIQSRLNGSYNVGLGQVFPSITQALIELKQLGVSGPVRFVLKDTTYSVLTGENFPLVLGPYANASPTNKVTIMPDSGVNVLVSGNDSITTIDFNNCSHFYIDGRQGGIGGFTSGTNLIIRNTTTKAPAIRFINDADSNQILYTDIRASNTSLMGFAGAGVVNFGTTDRTFGNDYNTIKLCHISGDDSLWTYVGISSIGSSSTIEAGNDNNIIDSCDIYNFSGLDAGSVAGIYVGLNNSEWKIRNNRFYQTTAQYRYSGNSTYGIVILSAYTNLISRGGFIIHNNFIGGSNASGNGYFEINGSSAHQFHGISVFVGTGIPTSIQGNTITNIKSTGYTLRGINLIRGNVNVGTIEGNTIGSRVNNGAIQGVVNSPNTNWIGISANGDPSDSFNIANNVISGIDIYGSLGISVPAFTGINLIGGNNVSVWNNLIGDTIPQNASIKISSAGGNSNNTQKVFGISMSPTSGTPSYNVFNNTVSNLFNIGTGLYAKATTTNGIILNASVNGIFNINHNLIARLYSALTSTLLGAGNSMTGIEIGFLGNCNVNNNIIRGLSISGTNQIASILGIRANLEISNDTAVINIIGNLIHTQMVWGNNPINQINGIQFSSRKSVVCNNMVRMGIDTLGNAIQTDLKLCGIYKMGGSSNVFNNSVYVGGSNVNNTTNNSYAYRRYKYNVIVDSLNNNIFINQRSNSLPGGPGHFALQFDDSVKVNSDNNLFFADTIGRVGNTVYRSLLNWRDGTSNDTNSIYGNAGFINPNGDINTVNLRINHANPTPVEGTGTALTGEGTDVDFDGKLRAANTPVDIGADAGVFTLLDLAPPIINHTTLLNTTSITDRVITATITDMSGVYSAGVLMPRVYFKKSASGIFQSTPGVLTSGNVRNGIWTFTISSTLLGGVAGNDSIYYFIVAQDSVSSTNIGSTPSGVEGTNVNNIAVFPVFNAYKITAIISGTFNVGVGQPFTSLTDVNGFFSYLNTSIVGGNITVNITSDIEESGIVDLLSTTETGAGNYNIRIQPNAPVLYNITGGVANSGSGLIRLAGAKRVTIDGRFSGSGRYLRFLNRQQAGVTLLLHEEAQKDTIRNCIVEGVNNTAGIIRFGASTVVGGIGNDSNAIIGCLIRDTLGTLATHNIANTSINCSGTVGRENDRIAILDNEMVNFGFNAINMTSSGTGDFWNISNNKIYQNIAKNNLMRVILVQGGSGHIIANNSIGGATTNRSGAAFTSTAGIIVIDITSTVGTTFPVTVSGNTISNLGLTGTSTANGVSGLRMAGGNLIISNNTIGGGMMPYDTIMNCYDGAIHIIGGASALVDNNLISHMNYYRASLNRNTGIHIVTSTTSPLTVQRNTIQNINGNQTATGTSSYRPAGITVTLAPVTGLTITQNNIRSIRHFNSGTGAYLASGIFYAGGASTTPIITQNRIRNIGAVGTGTGASAPEVSGICIISASNAVVANNQVSLGDSAFNQSRVYGIFDGTGGNNTFAYNSIFINGHTSAGVNHSSGFHRSTTGVVNFRNNLVYNKRTTSGTGFSYAVSSVSSNGFTGNNFNYNMFIVNDTARLLELPSGTSIGWSAMNNLYSSTYNTNWAERTINVAPQTLFIDTLNGNLGIDSSSAAAWYVNGKGIRIQNLSGDFNNQTGVRSTEITSGATDIGSVEFTPTSMPPIAYADKAPAANDSTQFYFASKLVAKAVWGSAGTLPSVVNLRYYSGTNPINTPTGSTFANAYYDMQATGGSGYNHNLTLMLDSAVLGSISSINRAQIANYQSVSSSWTRYSNTTISGNNVLFNAPALTNTGIFTFTDSASNPLPVSLSYFTAKILGDDVLLNWQTASEKNNRGFYLERSIDGKFFNEFDFVFGKGNSNILCNYSSTDISPFNNSSILYYRLKLVDFDGEYTHSKTIMVNLNNKISNALSIYPNPVEDEMYIEFDGRIGTKASIQMMDIHGKEVFNQQIQVNDGINKILIPEISLLDAGIYFAKIFVDGEVHIEKVVKK